MSTTSQRIEAAGQQIKGTVKRSLGRLIGDKKMETQGRAAQRSAHAKLKAVQTKETAKAQVEKATGTIKHRIGKALGNEQMMAEGKAKNLKGRARAAVNRSR